MKGLSFSEPMIKSWMNGTKTVTRRLINQQPPCALSLLPNGNWTYTNCDYEWSPPYRRGETVYIKETWRVGAWGENDNMIAVDYKADGYCRKEWIFLGFTDEAESQFYKLWQQSTDDAEKVYGRQEQYKWKPGQSPCRWRSPSFMPEWASRSHAEIVSVRPERVQEITEEDAMNEGITGPFHVGYDAHLIPGDSKPRYSCATAAFEYLWESLHPGSWERNDWVWRIELRKEANHA